MSNDLFAAKIGDPILHSGYLADLAKAVVKVGTYAAIGIAAAYMAGPAIAAIGIQGAIAVCVAESAVSAGVAMAVGSKFSGAINNAANKAGEFVDGLTGGKKTFGTIITGAEERVRTNSKFSARAAGSIPNEVIYAQLNDPDYGKEPPPEPEEEDQGFWEGAKRKAGSLWKGATNMVSEFFNPTVAPADPAAEPRDGDTVDCSKMGLGRHNVKYIAEGSKKVLITSQPAVRRHDRTTCEADIDTLAENNVRIGGPKAVVRDIKSGDFPFEQIFAVLSIAQGVRALFKSGSKWGCLALKLGLTTLGGKIGEGVAQLASGDPVHASTGAKLLGSDDEIDFSLQGLHPLIWQRFYNTLDKREGVLGKHWSLPFELSLAFREEKNSDGESIRALFFTDWQGREHNFGEVEGYQFRTYTNSGYHLYHFPQSEYSNDQIIIETVMGDSYLFESTNGEHFQLLEIYDQNSNKLTLRYNKRGLVDEIADPHRALVIHLHYHPHRKRLQSVIQRNESAEIERTLVTYYYDQQGQLIEVRKNDYFTTRRFAYDSEGRMAMHEDINGLKAFYQWGEQQLPEVPSERDRDTKWRIIAHWLEDEKGRELTRYRYNYDLTKRVTAVHQTGIGTKYHYWDERYEIVRYQDVLGEEWQFIYENELLIKEINPQGGSYTYGYDEFDNVESVTNPLGEKSYTKWHRHYALPLMEEDEEGNQWHYSYDERGNLLREEDPEKGETCYYYDRAGLITHVKNALGRQYHYHYNDHGLVIRMIDCSQYQTKVQYDEWQNVASVTDAMGAITHYEIDLYDRLTQIRLPDNRAQYYQYNEALQVTYIRDFAEREYRYHYNARGQVTDHQNPKGDSLHFGYDPLGRLEALQNEKGERYHFAYDALHRLTLQRDLLGIETHYRYDSLSQLTASIHYAQRESEQAFSPLFQRYHYDAIGRLVGRDNHDNAIRYHYPTAKTVMERFSQRGLWQAHLMKEEKEADETLALDFDRRGLLIQEANSAGNFIHQYDPLGNLLATELPDGRSLHHLYYGSGHLLQTNVEEGDDKTIIAEFERDKLHRETLRSQGKLAHHTRYDGIGRITKKTARFAEMPEIFAPVIEKGFSYDQADNLIQRTINYGAGKTQQAGITNNRQFIYDSLDQIQAKFHDRGHEQYNYDAAGNLFEEAGIRQGNQLTDYGTMKYTYDGFGRMLTREGYALKQKQRFHYDSENRVTKIELLNHPRLKAVEFEYDLIGRRIKKTAIEKETFHQDTITHFWWNGMQMINEINEKAKTSCLIIYNDFSYEPLARIERFNDDPTEDRINYFHTFINGCPEEMSNEEGQIIWHNRLNVWGKTLSENSVGKNRIDQNLRFQGQYLDRETGLHYNTFRYYDPEIGRFTQPDPIGLAGGINLYQYAPNTIAWIDPWGWWTYNTMPGIDGFQKHHIIPQQLRNHDLMKAANYNIHNSKNVIYLPKYERNHPTRTVHRGSHPTYNKSINNKMDIIYDYGQKKKWTQADYERALNELIKNERSNLRRGKTRLNKNSNRGCK